MARYIEGLPHRTGLPIRIIDFGRRIAALEMQTVGRKSDGDYGCDGHKYLTLERVKALFKAARTNRHGLRDALMVSLACQHGSGFSSSSNCAGAPSRRYYLAVQGDLGLTSAALRESFLFARL
jgi:hypothetical protein